MTHSITLAKNEILGYFFLY